MGSARMLYDMENGDFPYRVRKDSDGIHPIHPHHIGYFLEMSQVAAPVGQALYSHSDPLSQKNIDVKTGVNIIMFICDIYGKFSSTVTQNFVVKCKYDAVDVRCT